MAYVESGYVSLNYSEGDDTYVASGYVANGYVGVGSGGNYFGVSILAESNDINIAIDTHILKLTAEVNATTEHLVILSPTHTIRAGTKISTAPPFQLQINFEDVEITGSEAVYSPPVGEGANNVSIETLHIVVNYINNTNRNEYIRPLSSLLEIERLYHSVHEKITPSPFILAVWGNRASCQSFTTKRVMSIAGVEIKPYPYWNAEDYTHSHLSEKEIAVDGNSIVSLTKLGKYSKEVEIHGRGIKNNIIDDIISKVNSEEFEVVFTDAGGEWAKFNLTTNPISITPLYDNAEYSNITIRILV